MQLFTALYDSTLTQDTHFCGDRWSQRFGNARFGLITYESSFCGRLSLFASPPCCFAAGFTCHYIAHLSLGSRSQGKSLLVTLLSLLYATSVTFAGRTCYSSLCYISHLSLCCRSHLSLVALLQVALVTHRFVAGCTCHSSLCCRSHLSLVALLQVALVTLSRCLRESSPPDGAPDQVQIGKGRRGKAPRVEGSGAADRPVGAQQQIAAGRTHAW